MNAKKRHDTRNPLVKFCVLAALMCGLVPLPAFAAEPPAVELAGGGQARLAIVLVDPDGSLMQPAEGGALGLAATSAADLKATLDKMTGATFALETVAAYPGPDKPGIYIGRAKDLAFDGIDAARQQYGLRTTAKGQVLIAGADPRGISHGVYAMLHRLGCRWYYPGDMWAHLPAAKDLLMAADEVDGPDFYIQRRIWVGHGLHNSTTSGDFPAWCRRNGMAQPFDVTISHSWIGLDPENEFKDHPEWFALVNGERKNSKPCYAHPDVIARAKQTALKHFENNPGSAMISVSAPDGLGFCSCDLCKKVARVDEIYEAHGVMFGRQPDGREASIASETIFNMANEVAKAIAGPFPGKRVGIMAYSGYAHPPAFKLEPNIYLEVTAGYRRTPLTLPEQMTELGIKASALGVYEYYDVEQWSWDQPGRARASQLDSLQAATRFYHRNNVRSVSGEMSNNFGPNGIGYYAIARMLWDAGTDVRSLEEDFYRDCFGPAAAPIKRVYRRWESGQGFDDRALALAYRDLDEAAKLTAGKPAFRARVDRLRMYAHFLKNFLQVREASKGGDIAGWKAKYGEAGALARMNELGTWASRLIDTHMIHGWAFNRYFVRRGNDVGLDTAGWNQAGPIPTADEVEAKFKAGLADLASVKAQEVPAALYSRQLAPLVSGPASRIARPKATAVYPDSFRKATLEMKVKAGETVAVEFAAPGAAYSLLFTPKADYEEGGGSQYSRRVASGTLEGEKLEMKAEADGYYTLQWSDASLKRLDHPHALPAGQFQMAGGTFYFYVPAGTGRFILDAGAHGGPTLQVFDAKGKTMLDVKPAGDEPQTRFLVEVPKGSDGAVWKVVGPNCINRTGSINLIGVPRYFAFSPDLLLAPQEVVP